MSYLIYNIIYDLIVRKLLLVSQYVNNRPNNKEVFIHSLYMNCLTSKPVAVIKNINMDKQSV